MVTNDIKIKLLFKISQKIEGYTPLFFGFTGDFMEDRLARHFPKIYGSEIARTNELFERWRINAIRIFKLRIRWC